MCGIAGVLDIGGAELSPILDGMLSRLYHRGPDGEGRYVDPDRSLALGMRRLSIIDIAGGQQPIWNEDRTICVFFNGEIYNYKELTCDLRQRGHRFGTQSDTEVLVHLYEDYGEELTAHLRGMYAFCILDTRENSLFIARDHFGQKPLYYATQDGRFAFASELKALFVAPWIARTRDDGAFLDFACWLSLPPGRTHFRGISKLPAGYSLKVKLGTGNVTARQYWQFDLKSIPVISEMADAVGELDRVLDDSISKHLRADVPVGVLLSSGIDSQTVLAYAQAVSQNSLHTFSVGFGGPDSELAGAAAVARQLGSVHHELEMSASDFERSLDRVADLLDEPIGDPACFATLHLCELARSSVKVLLSGEGADELFGGYEERYRGMLQTQSRTRYLRSLRSILPQGHALASQSRWDRLLSRVHSTEQGEVAALRMEGLPGDISHPRFLREDQLNALAKRAEDLGREVFSAERDALSSLLKFDIKWQLAESLLQKADKMSMGASIELRTPFLDVEVARVASAICSQLKLPTEGPGKYVLRQTLASKTRSPIQQAKKKGFPVPTSSWLRGPLRERVFDELFSPNATLRMHLDMKLLLAAWQDFQNGWEAGRIFFALWLYERWTKQRAWQSAS